MTNDSGTRVRRDRTDVNQQPEGSAPALQDVPLFAEELDPDRARRVDEVGYAVTTVSRRQHNVRPELGVFARDRVPTARLPWRRVTSTGFRWSSSAGGHRRSSPRSPNGTPARLDVPWPVMTGC